MNTLVTVKKASQSLVLLPLEKRRSFILSLAQSIRQNLKEILKENQRDLASFSAEDPNYDRLLLTSQRIESLSLALEALTALPDPLGRILEDYHVASGLWLQRISVPLGVIGLIYESRPNVTVDSFALCFLSGNGCILKGGSEAYHSNQILVHLIKKALIAFEISPDVILLLSPSRQETQQLLEAHDAVDVIIPRGGKGLIDYVRKNARIPVIETGAGVVHTYLDASADLQKASAIITNAKTRRVSVCNALDCLLVHESCLSHLAGMVRELAQQSVVIYADILAYEALLGSYPLLKRACEEHYGKEFLSLALAVKTVSSVEAAIEHINLYSSGHSEAIISESPQSIQYFLDHLDAAVLYVNASTAFTDGGEFGMGAEIGISTQKLHVRGPFSMQHLVSSKWIVRGNGHIRD